MNMKKIMSGSFVVLMIGATGVFACGEQGTTAGKNTEVGSDQISSPDQTQDLRNPSAPVEKSDKKS